MVVPEGCMVDMTEQSRVSSSRNKDKYRSDCRGDDDDDLDRESLNSGAASSSVAVAEGTNKTSWCKGTTWKDVREILPTVLILLIGLLIMIFVIPYAFSSVIKQLKNEEALQRARNELAKNSTKSAEV